VARLLIFDRTPLDVFLQTENKCALVGYPTPAERKIFHLNWFRNKRTAAAFPATRAFKRSKAQF